MKDYSASTAIAVTAAPRPAHDVKLGNLLLLYLLVPALVLIAVLDQTLWNYSVLVTLPFQPESFVIWTFIFGMPHVFAGIQIFADKEYINKYGWRLGRIMAVCLITPLVVVALLGQQAMLLITAFMVMYHTVAQQFGLVLAALKKKPSTAFYIWKWSAVVISTTWFILMYWTPLPIVLIDNGMRDSLVLFVKILFAINCLACASLLWMNRHSMIGSMYIGANMALLLAELYFFSVGYYFFVVAASRIIHELSAWTIYMAHDENRNRSVRNNWIYRAFPVTVPQQVVTLFVSFVVGIIVMAVFTEIYSWATVIVSLSFYHYYTEHFLWRHDSLLRKSVKFI